MDIMSNPQDLLGRTVYGGDGEKLGKVGQVFLDDETGRPEWVTVQTGMFGTKETFVPLRDVSEQGGDLRVPYDKDKLKNAPDVGGEDGHINEQEEQDLYRHYGLDYADTTGTRDYDTSTTTTTTGTSGLTGTGDYATSGRAEGRDVSGSTTDDAMTRSEERVNVGRERVEAGRARLRKYVVTENVTQTVPVSKERVTVEREPITEGNVDRAMDGPAISEEEHEVVLHEERPVIEKETVPVERVRLGKEQVTEETTVSEEVRKEQIDTGDVEGTRSDPDRR